MSDPVAVSVNSTSTAATTAAASGTKRKRSPSSSRNGNQLQINYLARQCADDLHFISKDDTLPNLLDVLTSYSQVLDRQESLASNLGARPLGPILIKRFERCFDAPPKIIASHSHAKGTPQSEDEGTPTVTWLDVVHFAQAHPAQFALATFSEGRRVCQFYYPQKQVRVQVSEEDFLFISSGRCQDLIPPLPIWEDEEKEVGTCEILEKALRELTNAADMVAARTRQLGHRLKGRRMAIQERRTEQGHSGAESDGQHHSPSAVPARPSFVATNSHSTGAAASRASLGGEQSDSGASIRADLLKHFQSLPHNHNITRPEVRRTSLIQPPSPAHAPLQHYTPQSTMPPVVVAAADVGPSTSSSVSPAPTGPSNGHVLDPLSYYIENNPTPFRSSFAPANLAATDATPKHNFSRPLLPSQESSQPYRALCQAHMESLPRGSRVLPPCDRCRRLRMDCLKNLSSCAGCTKKHARCHWKDVRREEVQGLEGFDEAERGEGQTESSDAANAFVDVTTPRRPSEDDHIMRRSEERHDQANNNSNINLPPINHGEVGRHVPSNIDQSHAAPNFTKESNQTHQQQQQQQQSHQDQHSQPSQSQQHHENNASAGNQILPPNPFSARTEGDENRHAFDLLRLLSREATNSSSSPAAANTVGTRNNGAFRSVYNSHGPKSGPGEGSAVTPPSGNSGLVGVAGGDRP